MKAGRALDTPGEVPAAWPTQPRKLAQKDTDARWAKKGDQTFYGYKNHVKVGAKTKLIRDYTTTPASTNDGVVLPVLITAAERDVKRKRRCECLLDGFVATSDSGADFP